MARERRGAGSSVVSIETLYYKTIYYSKDVLEADEKSSIKENCPFIDVCFDDLPIYVYIYIYTQMLRGDGISTWMVVQ